MKGIGELQAGKLRTEGAFDVEIIAVLAFKT
jgi:hypothetical protein